MNEKLSVPLEVIASAAPALGRELISVVQSSSLPCEEIRLRADGICTVRLGEREIRLLCSVGQGELDMMLSRLCQGSVFAYRDTLLRGFVTTESGVRVGVAGEVSYDGGKCSPPFGIGSLVFRIPGGVCSFGEELFYEWCERGGGLLVVSPPAGGKTTVLASLAEHIGKKLGRRTVIVDERCEMDRERYKGCSVDVLRGYRRREGVEIAVRTMSPEVIVCDEIFTAEDSDAIAAAAGAGVTVLASAHGDGVGSVMRRASVSSLVDAGVFSSVAVITRGDGGFSYKLHPVGAEALV